MVRDELGELRRRLEAAEADLEQLRRGGRGGRWRPSARGVLIGVGLAVLLAPVGVAATGEVLREGVRNGTTAKETEIIGKFNAGTGAKGGYVTRQSNTQTGAKAGGGAIYGCRGAAGGTAAGSAPCLRASNLADGLAFEFASKSGPAGLFAVGSAGDAPFVTNGGGLVANLNADKVDGLDAAQLRGQQGPAGPQGVTGPAGPQGPRGPSDGVYRYDDDDISDAREVTKSIDLPAGSWIVNATVSADNDSGGRVIVNCALKIGGTKVDEASMILGHISEPGRTESFALTGGGTLSAAGTAVLECVSTGSIRFSDASLTATQVETLDTQ